MKAHLHRVTEAVARDVYIGHYLVPWVGYVGTLLFKMRQLFLSDALLQEDLA